MNKTTPLIIARLVFSSLFIYLASSAQARWAEPADAEAAVNFERVRIHVKKSGASTVEVERQVEILKDSARTSYGLDRLTLQSSSTFELVSAKTINGDRATPVEKHDVEIKPLASSGPGFDRQKQVTIAFPEVSVGSKLYMKYRRTISQPEIPGLYNLHRPLGWNEYVQAWELTIDSEKPLSHEIHDPGSYIKVEKKKNARRLHLQLTKPLLRWIMEEDGARMDPLALVWVGITTAADWSEIPKPTIASYDSTMAAALPAKFEKILAKARTLKDDLEIINLVTSELSETIRYVGDWRLVRGACHPRPLAKIAETGYGDCKDFTVSAGSLLKRLGFEVYAAWVARGRDWIISPLKLAAPYFNHAILFARKNGRDFWIDPTNTTSFAQGIYSDIANRPALVLTPGASELKWIPPQAPENGGIDFRFHLALDKNDVLEARGEFALRGHAAVSMTGAELSSTKKNIDYRFLRWLTDTSQVQSWEVGAYDLKSRIVKDIASSVNYKERWRPILTSAGLGYLVPPTPYLGMFRVRLDDRVSSLRLEDPVLWRREYHFTGRDLVFDKDADCDGQSPWADYSRALKREKNAAVLVDTVKLKVASVPAADLRKPEFADFQSKILRCMQEAVIVFR